MRNGLVGKVDLAERFGRIDEQWSPRIVAAVNDYDVKIAKVQGEFPWHTHDDTDELFLVVDGRLTLEVEGADPLVLEPGQIAVVPRGRPHRPTAQAETQILMLEPRGTRNTGDEDASGTIGEWLD